MIGIVRQHQANPSVHVKLNTADPDKAEAFYSKLFAWKTEDKETGSGMSTP